MTLKHWALVGGAVACLKTYQVDRYQAGTVCVPFALYNNILAKV